MLPFASAKTTQLTEKAKLRYQKKSSSKHAAICSTGIAAVPLTNPEIP